MISCMSSSTKMAIALSSPMILPLLLFGGFFINDSSIPTIFIVFKYISWFHYGNEAMVISQWKNVHNITCAESITVTGNSSSPGEVSTGEHRCLHEGLSVIDELSFNVNNQLWDISLLVVLIFAMRFIAFFALLRKSKRR